MKLTGMNSYTSWMVAVACCIINGLNLSAYRLAGLIYVELVNQYDTDRQTASIPIILFILIFCLGGPVVGLLGQKYGLEEITLIGCFLAAVGFGGCFFAEDISAVIVFLGAVYGVGITFGNTFLPNILKKYFTENLNSATGIYTSGSCIGAFVFPPVAIYLLHEYGVSGTFLIVSGIILNGVPVSMIVIMMRSTISTVYPDNKLAEAVNVKKERDIELFSVSRTVETNPRSVSQVGINIEGKHYPSEMSNSSADSEFHDNLPIKNNINLQKSYAVNDIIIKDDMQHKYINCENQFSNTNQGKLYNEEKVTLNISKESHNRSRNIKQVNLLNELKTKMNASQNMFESPESSSTLKRTPGFIASKSNEQSLRNSLRIFLEPTFFIIMAIQGMQIYIVTLVWTTLIDYSRDKGIDRSKEHYILMFLPLADLVGRLALGWVTDKRYLTLSKFTAMMFVLMAIFTVVIVLSKSFTVMMIGGLLFSSVSGCMHTILPVLIFEFMDQDQYIMGSASRSVLYGPLSFTSVPLIGYFRGKLGSYDGLYYVFTGMCLLCSCITHLLPIFLKYSKRKKEKSFGIKNIAT